MDNMTLALLALAGVCIVLYMMRRRKRLRGED